MKIKLLLIIHLVASCILIQAQITFQKNYGNISSNVSNCGQQTHDGGYIIVGTNGGNFYLAKTDNSGNMLWGKTYGTSNIEFAHSVQQTFDRGYIIAGATTGSGSVTQDVYIVKTDSAGNLQWSKTIGGVLADKAYYILQTMDGGYILTGRTTSFSVGIFDIYIVKTDSSGNIQWSKSYGGLDRAEAFEIKQIADGSYILTGVTTGFGGGWSAILIKTDNNGNLIWSKTYWNSDQVYGVSVQQTIDGGYIIGGSIKKPGSVLTDGMLLKTDSVGNIKWVYAYRGPVSEAFNSVQQTIDGGYIVAGLSNSFGAVSSDMFVVKTDVIGNLLWSKTYGKTANHQANSIKQTTDGGYVIVGQSLFSGSVNYQLYMVKTDSVGNSGCFEDNALPVVISPFVQFSTSVLTDSSGGITGDPITTISNTGTESVFCYTSSMELAVYNSFSIFPNPASEYFMIELSESLMNKNLTLFLYDITGKKVKQVEHINSKSIRIERDGLSNGFYVFDLHNNKSDIFKGKVILN